jgi:hypothetical protein
MDVVDQVAPDQIYGLPLLIIIPPLRHDPSPLSEVCDNPEQAAQYQILGL